MVFGVKMDIKRIKHMELLWEKCRTEGTEGARILRILGNDGQIEIPDQVWDHEETGKRLPVLEMYVQP